MAMIPWWIHYPNVNNEIINLDWILQISNENTDKIENFIGVNTIKYADPILWDITSQYEANTIVVDPQTGDAYISTKAVPYGVALSNDGYWTKIYNYASEIHTFREQIAADEQLSTTATAPRSVDDLVFLNGLLYIVTAPMIAGDSYVEGSNCVKTTINAELLRLHTSINAEAQARAEADTAEAEARAEADTALGERITAEAEDRAEADTALGERITAEAGARAEADTALGERITAEAGARAEADNELRNLIGNLGGYKKTFVNIKELGAVGDGQHHLLSDYYASLELAQVDYPFVTSLNTEIDFAVIQKACNNSDLVYIPSGTYMIDNVIELPNTGEHSFVIAGDGIGNTIIHGLSSNSSIFSWTRNSNYGGSTLYLKDLQFNGTSNNITAINFHGVIIGNSRYEDNWISADNIRFNNIFRCFDLYCCGNAHFNNITAYSCTAVFFLSRAASFINISASFSMGCGSFIYADDPLADGISNGIMVNDCQAVLSSGVPYRILGWQGVYIDNSSADLGSGEVQMFLYHVQDYSITNCWVAGNDVNDSMGVRLWDAVRGVLENCTISHCAVGVRCEGTGTNMSVTIAHNTIQANTQYDVYVYSVIGAKLIGNSAYSNLSTPIYVDSSIGIVASENLTRAATYTYFTATCSNVTGASNLFGLINII